MSSSDYFQCLICDSFLGTLWNAEKHLKTHQHNEEKSEERNLRSKRRGMTPIQKVTFTDCSVRVARIQWPIQPLPVSMKQLENDQSSEVRSTDGFMTTRATKRPQRQARLKADQRITQLAATLTLKLPEGAIEHMDLNKSVLKKPSTTSGYYDDDDFQCERPRKRKQANSKSKSPIPTKSKSLTAPPKGRKDDADTSNAKCEHCPASHSSQRDLADHIAHNHQDKVNVLICPISACKVPTLNSFWLGRHLCRHTGAERKELHNSIYSPEETLKSLKRFSPTFCCKFCLSRHESFEIMQSHQAEVHHGFNLKCPSDCGRGGFDGSVIALLTHIRIAHPHLIKDLKTECKFNGLPKKDSTGDHDTRTPFLCPICKKCFSNKNNFRRHFHLHLENNPFVCDIPFCNQKFNSAYNLRRHKARHDPARVARRYVCPKCSVTYVKKESIVKHLKDFHGLTKSPKDLIPGQGSKKPQVRKRNIHAGFIPAYTAEEIKALREKQKSSILNSVDESVPVLALAVPLKQEVNPDPPENSSKIFKVEAEVHFVDRIILQEDGTAEHITGEQLIPDETFSMEEGNPDPDPEYISHFDPIAQDPAVQRLRKNDPSISILHLFPRKTHVYNNGKSFTCSECKNVFNRAWTLQLHMTTQHNKTIAEELLSEKCNGKGRGRAQNITLMCGTCAYPAKSKRDLTSHMKTHEQAQHKWKCLEKRGSGVCGRVFTTQKKLDTHVNNVHFGSRDFSCKECPKAFITERDLKIHKNIVHQRKSNGEKMTKTCPICQAVLAPSTYNPHVKRHRDESEGMVAPAPRCMLCHDTFSGKMALQRHIDAVHLGKPVNKIRHAAAAARRKAKLISSKKSAESIDPLLQKSRESKDIIESETSMEVQHEEICMEAELGGNAGEILGF